MPARRAASWIPPVVVGSAVAALLGRALLADGGARAGDALRARFGVPSEVLGLPEDVDRFLAEHGDAREARWLAAEAFARVARFERALDAVWEHEALAADPATPRRLALLLLEHLARGPAVSNRLGPRTLLARAEADAPGARAELLEILRGPSLLLTFLPTFDAAILSGRTARRLVAEGLRAHAADDPTDAQAAVGAAILTVDPEDRSGLPLLLERFPADDFRADRLAWPEAARALAASGDPAAVAALRAARESPFAREASARLVLDVALAVADDPAAREAVETTLEEAPGREWVGVLYARGLANRLEGGDEAVVPRLADLWRIAGPRARRTLASTVLLGDERPPAGIPAALWVGDLEGSPDALFRALGAAYRWRTGDARAADALLEVLHRAFQDPQSHGRDAEGIEGSSAVVLEVLRAWARWPRPPAAR
jgi:hypothetical protein